MEIKDGDFTIRSNDSLVGNEFIRAYQKKCEEDKILRAFQEYTLHKEGCDYIVNYDGWFKPTKDLKEAKLTLFNKFPQIDNIIGVNTRWDGYALIYRVIEILSKSSFDFTKSTCDVRLELIRQITFRKR